VPYDETVGNDELADPPAIDLVRHLRHCHDAES
jgi:hypothetical protein